jgi:hypothetical protein
MHVQVLARISGQAFDFEKTIPVLFGGLVRTRFFEYAWAVKLGWFVDNETPQSYMTTDLPGLSV